MALTPDIFDALASEPMDRQVSILRRVPKAKQDAFLLHVSRSHPQRTLAIATALARGDV